MKFNLHLFQGCHRNAYKEQAHDSDLQWLHSPQGIVAFKGWYGPAGDIPQYCSSRGGKGCPRLPRVSTCWRDYSEARSLSLVHQRVSPSPESTADDPLRHSVSFGMMLNSTLSVSPPREAASVRSAAGGCSEGRLGAHGRWLGHTWKAQPPKHTGSFAATSMQGTHMKAAKFTHVQFAEVKQSNIPLSKVQFF